MSGPRFLHVIGQLRRGGPLQALISLTKRSTLRSAEHHIVSLTPADRYASEQAAQAGISGTSAPPSDQLGELVASADIVQVHFWNHPAIHAFLAGPLPAARLLLWCHVNGSGPPHVIPAATVQCCDAAVVLRASTLARLTGKGSDSSRMFLVESLADFTRLVKMRPVPHSDFCIGYVGTLDFVKMHENYARMSAAVRVPEARFLLCGDGGSVAVLKQQLRGFGIGDRFEFLPHVEDLAPVLGRMDVFGYPLSPTGYAAAELALQEAMYAGVPPVVFDFPGAGEMVHDKETGRVVRTEAEYAAAIEWLYHHPDERRRLGANAAAAMRELAARTGCPEDAIYQGLMAQPKRSRPSATAEQGASAGEQGRHGAWAFVRSLDGCGDADFLTSLTGSEEADVEQAERRIPLSSVDVQNTVLLYRFHYPADPVLRLWSGRILLERGRPALAAAEFSACSAQGFDAKRLSRYLQESRSAANVPRA